MTIRQINRFVGASPVRQGNGRRARMAYSLLTGDLADSQQYNETLWVRQLLEGQGIDPNSGTGDLSACTPVARALLGAARWPAARRAATPGCRTTRTTRSLGDYYDPDEPLGTFAAWPRYPGLMDRAQVGFQPEGLQRALLRRARQPRRAGPGQRGVQQRLRTHRHRLRQALRGHRRRLLRTRPLGAAAPTRRRDVRAARRRPAVGDKARDQVDLRRRAASATPTASASSPAPRTRPRAARPATTRGTRGRGCACCRWTPWPRAARSRRRSTSAAPTRATSTTRSTAGSSSELTRRHRARRAGHRLRPPPDPQHGLRPCATRRRRRAPSAAHRLRQGPARFGADPHRRQRALAVQPLLALRGLRRRPHARERAAPLRPPAVGGRLLRRLAVVGDQHLGRRRLARADPAGRADGQQGRHAVVLRHAARPRLAAAARPGSGSTSLSHSALGTLDRAFSYNDPDVQHRNGDEGGPEDRNAELLLLDPRRSSAGLRRRLRTCGLPNGSLSGRRVGAARLGVLRRTNRRAFPSFRRSRRSIDRFCIVGRRGARESAIRCAACCGGSSSRTRRRVRGRAVLALTSSRVYSARGVRAGSCARLMRRRHRAPASASGSGATSGTSSARRRATLLFKVRRGRVRELGLAERRLTSTAARGCGS